MVKVFMPLMSDEFIGPLSKTLYTLVKKYDVSEEECLFLRHCCAHMGRESLAPGVVKLYHCSLEEAVLIIDAVNF